ncbi:HlyD family efflux transporter periplasmic adaptor subunit [Planosporangium flavigriseum]|nr:HlyD family efflux transporter periplasmic adaptor subunit [Planosporangium flavigriseum]NJC66440.1 HlyD family efflux transporter periplasmic adaptor subunit [Planosporangium flavigriseum]
MTLRLPAHLRGRGPALWLTLGTAAVGATAVTAIAYAGGGAPAAAGPATVRVQRGVVELTSSAAGTVQAMQSRGLSFSTGGTVTEVEVKPGDSVAAGQVLARIDSSAAQDDVNTAQASVNSATNALARAQQTTTPSPSTCQNTAVRAAPVAYVVAGSASPSTSASASPSSSPDPSPSDMPSPSASPSRQGPGSGSGQTSGRTSETPPGGCATGGSAGGSAGGSTSGRSGSGDSLMSAEQQLTNAQLALQLAQDRLAGTTITAPVAGKVLSVAGTVGSQETPASSGFIVLGGVTDTGVRAEFSEADVAHLAVGQTATITLPNRDGAQVKGKVSQIDPAGTTSGRLVRYGVLVSFDEVPADLLLGQSANVTVVTASAPNVLYVPSAAVTSVTGDNGAVTVRSTGRDQHRTVRVGLRGDQYTQVLEGLQGGDELVLPGSR